MRHESAALALSLVLTLVLGLACAAAVTVTEAQAQTPPSAGPSFKALDTDKSGHLSLDEVLAHAKKHSTEVQPFHIRDVDLDGDGKLSPEEQRKAGLTGLGGLEPSGSVDLKAMDIHGDGYISREDLDEYFRRKHREAYARADADKDGRLGPSEFALYRF